MDWILKDMIVMKFDVHDKHGENIQSTGRINKISLNVRLLNDDVY